MYIQGYHSGQSRKWASKIHVQCKYTVLIQQYMSKKKLQNSRYILNFEAFYYFLLLLAPSCEGLVGRFQLALYTHYINGGEPIYKADEMEQFANTHAPTLFTLLLNSITNGNSAQSKERDQLQRKRTVALLHIISYFR